MKIYVQENYEEMSKMAAYLMSSHIRLKPESILGLATGDTPLGLYNELIKMHQQEGLDFSKVTTFNLDEYCDLKNDNPQSYHYFMYKNFFNKVNINYAKVNIPNGNANDMEKECIEYERKLQDAGGIDIQLLGLGRNGHIGFNEPDASFEALTHIVSLKEDTIKANSRFFDSIDEVPKKAISMGIKSIMMAKQIILLVSGSNKADSVCSALNGKICPEVPASVLQLHNNVVVILDKQAAAKL